MPVFWEMYAPKFDLTQKKQMKCVTSFKIRLENTFSQDEGASDRLRRAWFGNNMTVLEVKETACAGADEKQRKAG